MKEYIDPFLYNLPHLDLHGCERTTAVAMTKIFIDENVKVDNKKIVVVHGKGHGIVRKSVHEYLKNDKRVTDYKTNNYNDGETIITLK